MPKGTPLGLKCPKCKRGKWGKPPARNGVHPTGEVEGRITSSACHGTGSGGVQFRGYRGKVRCGDCGHEWFSTHPRSGLKFECECVANQRFTLPKLTWVKAEKGVWTAGDYRVWIQACVREGDRHIPEYAAQYRDEKPWLCEHGPFSEAKLVCVEHAQKHAKPNPLCINCDGTGKSSRRSWTG